MKMSVQITEANEVIGNGVGAVMQVREVLRILQQHPERAIDLENKALHLAANIIEMVGKAKGKAALKLATEQLTSGKAWEKMQEIVATQGGNPDINSENLNLGQYTHEIFAERNGKIKVIDLHDVNAVCRKLGCPIIDQAGMYLHKKTGNKVKKGELLCTLYAQDETKLKLGIERWNENPPITY